MVTQEFKIYSSNGLEAAELLGILEDMKSKEHFEVTLLKSDVEGYGN